MFLTLTLTYKDKAVVCY